MIASVVKHRLDARDGIARDGTGGKTLFETFFHGGEILFGNGSADHFLFKHEGLFAGLKTNFAVTVLAVSARLFLVFALRGGDGANGFAVGDFRFRQLDVHAVARLYLFRQHFDLRIALSADEDFSRLGILFHRESIIFFGKFIQPRKNFVLLSFLFGGDRHKERGFRETYRVEFYFRARVAERVARRSDTQFIYRADVARQKFGDGFRLFALQKINLTDALFFFRVCVPDDASALQSAAENFQITEFSRVGVDDRLEHLRCERSGRIGKDIHDLIYHKVGGERIHAFVRFGHIGDDFVQKIDDAAILQSAARHDGDRIHRRDAEADSVNRLFTAQCARFEIFVEQDFVVFRGGLHEAGFHFLHFGLKLRGNGDFLRAGGGETIRFFL